MRNILFLFLAFSFFACDGLIEEDPIECDFSAEINGESYLNADSDPLTLSNIEIIGDCLSATFTGTGCDGLNWSIRLFDSNEILESFPVQRNLRFTLDENEDCDAVISRDLSFNLDTLQIGDTGTIILNILNFDIPITYEY